MNKKIAALVVVGMLGLFCAISGSIWGMIFNLFRVNQHSLSLLINVAGIGMVITIVSVFLFILLSHSKAKKEGK